MPDGQGDCHAGEPAADAQSEEVECGFFCNGIFKNQIVCVTLAFTLGGHHARLDSEVLGVPGSVRCTRALVLWKAHCAVRELMAITIITLYTEL